MAGDEKGAKDGDGCYYKGDINDNILLVDLLDDIEREIAKVDTDVDDTNDNIDNNKNDKVEGKDRDELLE